MVEDKIDELSIYDLVDVVWRYRWLLVGGLIIGIAGSVAGNYTPQATTRDIHFSIYPAGSPSYGSSELAAQLYATMEKAGYVPRHEAGKVIVPITSNLGSISETARQFESMIDQVATDATQILANNRAAATSYTEHLSYISGRKSGRINLISGSVVEHLPSRSPTRILAPFFGALLVASMIAVSLEFIRGWRHHRAIRQRSSSIASSSKSKSIANGT